MQSVDLEWHGPFSIDEFGEYEISAEIMGIYAFVDTDYDEQDHRWIYHRGTLMYTGKAYKQRFIDRLNQHLREEGYDDPWPRIERNHKYEVRIKVARVILNADERISGRLLGDMESLLIAVSQPRANISGTRTYGGRDFEIRNTRQYKPLQAYVSTNDLPY